MNPTVRPRVIRMDGLSLDDEVLFAAARQGDEQALERLVDAYRQPLFGFFMRMAGNAHRAEDLFQEAWVRVWCNRDRFRANGRFRPWLYAIAANLARDDGRRRRVRENAPVPTPVAAADDPACAAEREEAASRVRAAVEGLSDTGRETVVLFYYQCLDQREVAETLGIPLGTVKSRLHYALARIAETMGVVRAGP